VIREYRRGWDDDAGVRAERRAAVAGLVPPLDWLWQASELAEHWVETAALELTGQRLQV
jgi:hypothetical protein